MFATEGAYYSNMSLGKAIAESANMQGQFVLLPFAIASKNWDGISSSAAYSSGLKLLGMTISLIMVKRLGRDHSLWTEYSPPGCASVGCPVIDGSSSDDVPLTPLMSEFSEAHDVNKPVFFMMSGASMTMVTFKFLLGTGPLGIWTFGALNVCPFSEPSKCTAIGKIKDAMVDNFDKQTSLEYWNLVQSFSVYKPEFKLLEPYCGDPLTYDEFEAECSADGVCINYFTVIPSKANKVVFSMDVWITTLAMLFVGATPVSARFVNDFIPERMLNMEYYHNMAKWFPSFSLIAPQKGGVAFTNPAGNALMDFMTFLNMRLTHRLLLAKMDAFNVWKSWTPKCGYSLYNIMTRGTYDNTKYLMSQQLGINR